MAAKKDIVSIELPHVRDTKGTHVFATEADNAKVKNVYVQKGTFEGDKAPETITLTISA